MNHLFQLNQLIFQIFNKKFGDNLEIVKKQNQYFMSLKEKVLKPGHRIDKTITDFDDYLKMLNKRIFQIEFFKNYSTINLFIHEKGNNFADRYEIEKQGKKSDIDFNQQEILMTEFNSLFQSIKKSKNKSFGQANLKGTSFDIIGTFLSHDIVVENFSIIFIISRNEFLPQDSNDISEFNDYRHYIKNIFYNFATRVSLARQINHINHVTEFALPKLNQERTFKVSKNKKIISVNNKIFSYDKINSNDLSAMYFHNEKILLLGDLLNTLRHELSNPLFGIKLNSELLKLDSSNAEHIDIFNNIISAENRCETILQTFTTLFNNNNSISTDLLQSIPEVITILKAEIKNIKINLFYDKSIHYIAQINPAISMQIFFNLLLNSIQAIKDNEILLPKIDIYLKKENQLLVIDLIDNGPGISEHKHDRIFEKFYTTKAKGTGLGLSITKTLLDINNGSIKVIKNNNEHGAHFNITLPLDHK